MANFIFIIFLSLSNLIFSSLGFEKPIPKSSNLNLKFKIEKQTHLHFYFHDTFTGPNPTVIRVAQSPTTATSPTSFGAVSILDDPLTVGPELSSQRVGSAQGMYSSASQTELAYLMVLTFVFGEGKYNGSTLSVLGRNEILEDVREMAIVGGTRAFRFARGYAEAKTVWRNATTRNAIVEYDVYVLHY